MTMPDEPLKYFTPPEAAEYLRTSVSTLAKLRVYGGGPAFTRIGRAIRYPRTSLDTHMTDQLVRSTSEKRVVTGSANTADAPINHRKNEILANHEQET
jgi:excisionase family DNA binding protein